MSPVERIQRNAYASPWLRGQRARISRWERAREARRRARERAMRRGAG